MKNKSTRSFGRVAAIWVSDFQHVSRSVVAVVLVFGLCVLPCLYGWFNIFSNWDPYGTDATSRVKVGVFSGDEGTSLLGIDVNLGDTVISNLKSNNQIGWQFYDSEEETLEAVTSGECYAALIIPSDFSKDTLSFINLKFKHPQVDYYENQKKNAIAPKITEKASSTVQSQVNSTFAQAVVSAVAGSLQTAEDSGMDLPNTFQQLASKCREIASLLDETQTLISSTISILDNASGFFNSTNNLVGNAAAMASSASQLSSDLYNDLNQIQATTDNLNSVLISLTESGSSAEEIAQFISSGIYQMYDTLQATSLKVKDLSETLVLFSGNTSGTLASGMDNLYSMKQQLQTTSKNLTKGHETLVRVADTLEAFSNNESLLKIRSVIQENGDEISTYFSTPVKMNTVVLYPIDNYGSAMSPFYTVLAQWVGALFCACLIKIPIRREDVPLNLNVHERFFGRFGIFFAICMVQAILVSFGDLFFIGIDCAHPGLFILAALVTGLSFCMINYALLFSLDKIGLASSIIIMVVQVAGSGGTYPVEVVPKIFQVLYPYMPFRYAMNAMREAVAGTYDSYYAKNILMLFLTALVFMVLGQILYFPVHKLCEAIHNSNQKAEIMY